MPETTEQILERLEYGRDISWAWEEWFDRNEIEDN